VIDDRCGDERFRVQLSSVERVNRCQRFDYLIRGAVSETKKLWPTHFLFSKDGHNLLTNGIASLFKISDEDYLVEMILSGVPETTKLILGKENLTVEDLLDLPCQSDDVLQQNSIHVNISVRKVGSGLYEYKIYVGLAGGKFGICQRWFACLDPVRRMEAATKDGNPSLERWSICNTLHTMGTTQSHGSSWEDASLAP
jgi:hypothetical protein